MNGVTLSLTLTACTLSCRPALLLDFKQGSFGMSTPRNSMSFDTSRAGEFLLVDKYHNENLVGEEFGRRAIA